MTCPTPHEIARLVKYPKWQGNGSFMCLCPYHDDTKRSMHVGPGRGYHCYGCRKSGTLQDLMSFLLTGADPAYQRRVLDRTSVGSESRCGLPGVVVATYDYKDDDSTLLYQVVRYHPKTFRCRRPDGNGGWKNDIRGVRRVPYHLPDILTRTDEVVWIVEGEKDADGLYRGGLLATTNCGGVNAWSLTDWRSLRDRSVVFSVIEAWFSSLTEMWLDSKGFESWHDLWSTELERNLLKLPNYQMAYGTTLAIGLTLLARQWKECLN